MHLTYFNLHPPTSSILSSKHRNNANKLFCVLVNMLIVPVWNITSVTTYQLKKKGSRIDLVERIEGFHHSVSSSPNSFNHLILQNVSISTQAGTPSHSQQVSRLTFYNQFRLWTMERWMFCSKVIPKVTVTVILQGGQSILSSSWLLGDGGSESYDWEVASCFFPCVPCNYLPLYPHGSPLRIHVLDCFSLITSHSRQPSNLQVCGPY